MTHDPKHAAEVLQRWREASNELYDLFIATDFLTAAKVLATLRGLVEELCLGETAFPDLEISATMGRLSQAALERIRQSKVAN